MWSAARCHRTQGGESDATEIEGLDGARALGFLLDVEICGQVRPVNERITEDEQRYQSSDDSGQEQRTDVVEETVTTQARAAKSDAAHQSPHGAGERFSDEARTTA